MGQEKGYGVFPVVEGGRLAGVVTESDIVRLMIEALGVTERGTLLYRFFRKRPSCLHTAHESLFTMAHETSLKVILR